MRSDPMTNATQSPARGVEKRARELLAATYSSDHIRDTVLNTPMDQFGQWFSHAIEAISSALAQPQEGWVLVPRERLQRACDIAMRQSAEARIPECGDFSAIAQDLDAMLSDTPPAQPEDGSGEVEKFAKIMRMACDNTRAIRGRSEVAVPTRYWHQLMDLCAALAIKGGE